MVKPLSGALLAEKMANGTLTNEEQNAINAQRKKKRIYKKVENLHVAMQLKQKKKDV